MGSGLLLKSKRLILLGGLSALFLFIYTFSPISFKPYGRDSLIQSRVRSGCTPDDWANGQWVPRKLPTDKTAMTHPEDVLDFTGFESCASSREFFIHLAANDPNQWDRFPNVTSWQWQPADSCNIRALHPEELVRDMVEKGGWLLVGDSVTEQQFFSLSCVLYPHVRAIPDYEHAHFDRAYPQNLLLNPDSPLVTKLKLPPGFNLSSTPLVTYRRVDLMLSKDELLTLHSELYHPPHTFSLFSQQSVWTMSPHQYMDIFQSPLPEGNYGTLVINTAGHWVIDLFHGFRNHTKSIDEGSGIDQLLPFFREAMTRWADVVQSRLKSDIGTVGGRSRQVVVRAYNPGHPDCHSVRHPWKEWKPYTRTFWNWPWIGEFNDIFQDVLSSSSYPDIHFLAIDKPGRLRPDAHVTGDCLHIMAGAGIIEGWTQYIWHYITREIPGIMR
ncbi:hypothetical protein K474DRAFT_893448 [Panus rudis PR-1116 ss-1]|nr:hypothetical protein K474DRAFT_893448 [Panus rudis PR-1116 ss-1]